jgi:ribosomal protein L37AE/L43A
MEKEKKKPSKPECSKCGSKFTYVRIKEGSVVCRSCGNIDQKGE